MAEEDCGHVCVWLCVQLKAMREVMQGDASNPKVTMGNNYRPVMQIHQRTVRTNINFNNPVQTAVCCACVSLLMTIARHVSK